MIVLLILILSIYGCKETVCFNYGDEIIFIEGFYENQEGKIIRQSVVNTYNIRLNSGDIVKSVYPKHIQLIEK